MNLNSSGRAALLALAALSSCKVDRQSVHQRVYACDPKAVDPGCGTDELDGEMMCFASRPLGGTDFCAERCGADLVGGEGALCASSGARLKTCNPANGNADCGDPALGCFRNNALEDGGICVTITPCDSDDQCRDPVRSKCAATIVREIYQNPASFKNDHLWCLQAGCQERRTACSPGESCLRDLIPASFLPPDICVPNCDSNLRCPPAHECYRKTAGPAAPAICIPGLLGFSCDSDIDCMMGDCVATGAGRLKVCSTKCGNDADCMKYDGQQGTFICNPDHQCVSPGAFAGIICKVDSDCIDPGLTCAHIDPDSKTGSCLAPCGADGSCAPRGGVPHTCIPRIDQGFACIPGYMNYPCISDDGCLPGMSCRPLGPGLPNICTNLCQDDNDCTKVRWTAGGYCQPLAEGVRVCMTKKKTGEDCQRDGECASKLCVVTKMDGGRTCNPG